MRRRSQHGSEKRQECDRGGPGARLSVRTASASWLARRVASLDKGKAAELRRQVAEIAEASGLDLKVRRSRRIPVSSNPRRAARHADPQTKRGPCQRDTTLVIVDETGLFPLRARDLLAGLRSSVSARAGKIRHISIRGDSELFRGDSSESCGRVARLRGCG